MKRKITKRLMDWKESEERSPLIIQGARQVGKTYTVLEFAGSNYKNCIYLNFENNTELINVFKRDLDPDRIILELSAFSGQSILKEDTLIFFDEIQECDRALTSFKYFKEIANEYHIIAAGSLLGVAVNRERVFFPVGKVDMMTLSISA